MAKFTNDAPRGKHGKHASAGQESVSSQQPEAGIPQNTYQPAANYTEARPYANRQDEVARLRKKQKKSRRKAPKIIAAVIIVLVVLIGGTGVAFGLSAMDAKDDAQTLLSEINDVKDNFTSGDMEAAKTSTAKLSATTTSLHEKTSSPLWTVASVIPVVGNDIHTVQVVSDSADVLVNDVLVPALDIMPAEGLSGIMGEDGAINVDVLSSMLSVVSDSAPQISEYAEELESAPEPVISQLKSPVEQVTSIMTALAPVAESATQLNSTLPAMLGAEGARNYLVIACTSAEMRSSVGFAGSYGVMTVDNGKISIGDFAGYDTNPRLASSVAAATEEDMALFRWETSVDARDVTQIIDFERVGEIESQIWEANGHGSVDGVIALDTIVLERMLDLTGMKVTTPGGDVLDGSTTSDFLLNGVYKKYPDGTTQDAVFALVANAAADAVFNNIGKVKVTKLADVLQTSAEEGRICAYMADSAEEAVLEDLGVSGTVSSDLTTPETGVYMSACSGGKMYYYLASDVKVGAGTKNSDGSTTYDVTVEFDDTLTSAEVATLTNYITNSNPNYDGSLDFFVYLLAPTGGKITDVKTEGTFYGANAYPNQDFAITAGGNDAMNESTYQGNDIWYGWTHVAMGGKTVLTYKVTTSTSAEEGLFVHTTPLANETTITYN